jgi:SSS family solute:Na+ symporter
MLTAFLITVPVNVFILFYFPEMNYFVRAFWVIFTGLLIALLGNRKKLNSIILLFEAASVKHKFWGFMLLLSLLITHAVFH